jgi:hypothetical protein
MLFYALTDSRLAGAELGEVVEFYATLDEAERARSADSALEVFECIAQMGDARPSRVTMIL